MCVSCWKLTGNRNEVLALVGPGVCAVARALEDADAQGSDGQDLMRESALTGRKWGGAVRNPGEGVSWRSHGPGPWPGQPRGALPRRTHTL